MTRFTALVLPLLLLAAAASAQEVQVSRTTSEFDSSLVLSAPTLTARSDSSVGQGDQLNVTIRLLKDKASGSKQWFVVLGAMYDSTQWRHYNSVSLVGGAELTGQTRPGTVLSCYGGGLCRFSEILAVPVDESVARRAGSEGLRTRWNAQTHGTFNLDLPASHFKAVAAAADQQ